MLCRQHSEEASLLGFQVNWTKTKIQCNRDIDSVPQMVHVGSRQAEVIILLVKCPDDIPSLRLYDGELNVIMRKLNDMNINLAEYASVLAAIGQQVRAIQVCSHPASSRMTAALPDVGGDIVRNLIDRNSGESLIETTAGIPQPVPGESESSADWATAASTPFLSLIHI